MLRLVLAQVEVESGHRIRSRPRNHGTELFAQRMLIAGLLRVHDAARRTPPAGLRCRGHLGGHRRKRTGLGRTPSWEHHPPTGPMPHEGVIEGLIGGVIEGPCAQPASWPLTITT